jgi:hypothetical protein
MGGFFRVDGAVSTYRVISSGWSIGSSTVYRVISKGGIGTPKIITAGNGSTNIFTKLALRLEDELYVYTVRQPYYKYIYTKHTRILDNTRGKGDMFSSQTSCAPSEKI